MQNATSDLISKCIIVKNKHWNKKNRVLKKKKDYHMYLIDFQPYNIWKIYR